MDTDTQSRLCPRCGSDIEPDDLFCPRCGGKIKKNQAAMVDFPESSKSTKHPGPLKKTKRKIFFKLAAILVCVSTLIAAIVWYSFEVEKKTARYIPVSVAFDPSRETMACGLVDGTVEILQNNGGKPIAELKIDTSPVISLYYNSGGNKLAACCSTGEIHIVSIPDYKVIHSDRWKKRREILFLTLSEDWRYQAMVVADTLELYDINGNLLNRYYLAQNDQPRCVAISEESRLIAIGGAQRVKLWNIDNGNHASIPFPDIHRIESIQLDSHGRLLFVNGVFGSCLYDLGTRKVLCKLRNRYGEITGISVDPSGQNMAICNKRNRTVTVFSVGDCKPKLTIHLIRNQINRVLLRVAHICDI